MNMFVVLHKHQLLAWFSEEQIENADENGYIGTLSGIEFYLNQKVKVTSEK